MHLATKGFRTSYVTFAVKRNYHVDINANLSAANHAHVTAMNLSNILIGHVVITKQPPVVPRLSTAMVLVVCWIAAILALETVESACKVEFINRVQRNVEELSYVRICAKQSALLLVRHVDRNVRLCAPIINVVEHAVNYVCLVDTIVNGSANIPSVTNHVQNLVTDHAVINRAKRFFQVFSTDYQLTKTAWRL